MQKKALPPAAVDFSDLDLNLLKVFDIIMQERNLTRAAARLGKSVAGTSHALRRLRTELKDELFETPGRGMVPTRRALEIAPCIRECLGALRVGLAAEPTFDPKLTQRTFTLDIPVGGDCVFAPALMRYADKHAPGVSFRLLSDRAQVLHGELRYGETDIAIDYDVPDAEEFRHELLYDDPFVLMSRRNHPALPKGRKITAELYQGLPHVGLSWTRNRGDGPIVDRLSRQGIERRPKITVLTAGALPGIIETTNLVCAMSERTAKSFARRFEIDLHPLGFSIGPIPISMVWHERFDRDLGHAWLREALKAACSDF